MSKRSEIFSNYSYNSDYYRTNKKNKYNDTIFTDFFGNDVDGTSLYHNMKNASQKINPMNISGLPCNILCDPEENSDSNKLETGTSTTINNITSIFFPNTSHIDTYGLFNTEIEKSHVTDANGDQITFGKSIYTDKNFVTNSLIALDRFGQTISKDAPKAPRLRLNGFYCQVDMSIILNTEKNKGGVIVGDPDNPSPDYDKILYEPPGNFIVTVSLLIAKKESIFVKDKIGLEDIFKKGTYRFDNTDNEMPSRIIQDNWELMTAVDTPVNVNDLLKNNQAKCCNKPFLHNFSMYVYYSHTQSSKGQKTESQGMPFGVARIDDAKNIIIYCCDKDNVTNMPGYQPNVIWVLTVTSDPKMLKRKIENSLQIDGMMYNNDITYFGNKPTFPLHTGPFLLIDKIIPIMGYDTNMDSMSNMKFTSGSAMQQLVEAVRAAMEKPPDKETQEEDSRTDSGYSETL